MALISMRQMLDHAAEHGYGVPAFNVNNLEQMRAIMEAADETDSPVIIQPPPVPASTQAPPSCAISSWPPSRSFRISRWPCTRTTVPARRVPALHPARLLLGDDGRSLGEDGKTPTSYAYNVDVTRRTVEMAHACGVSVEGELGCLGSLETGMAGEEDGVGAEGKLDHDQLLTDPKRPPTSSRPLTWMPWPSPSAPARRLQVHPSAHRRHPLHPAHQGDSCPHPGDAPGDARLLLRAPGMARGDQRVRR